LTAVSKKLSILLWTFVGLELCSLADSTSMEKKNKEDDDDD